MWNVARVLITSQMRKGMPHGNYQGVRQSFRSHTLSLWKWMVGIRSFPFRMANFQGRTVSFREGRGHIWVHQNSNSSWIFTPEIYKILLRIMKLSEIVDLSTQTHPRGQETCIFEVKLLTLKPSSSGSKTLKMCGGRSQKWIHSQAILTYSNYICSLQIHMKDWSFCFLSIHILENVIKCHPFQRGSSCAITANDVKIYKV